MVKAETDFWYKIDKNGRYHQDGEIKLFKKGDTIPAGIVPRIAYGNPEYINCLDSKKRNEIVEEALKETGKLIEDKKVKYKKLRYTIKEVENWIKEEQVEFLQKQGLTSSEIKKLKLEKERVNKIMQLLEEEL